MSDFQTAYDWMMANEDSRRLYETVPDYPPGAHAISGINSASFPDQFQAINALPQDQRGEAVEQFYQRNFWSNWLQQIESDEVAKRVFDMAVNGGSGTSVRLLQQAVNTMGHVVGTDGLWGPVTLAAANACDPAELVDQFKIARASHYQAIVDNNPAQSGYLQNWLARAAK